MTVAIAQKGDLDLTMRRLREPSETPCSICIFQGHGKIAGASLAPFSIRIELALTILKLFDEINEMLAGAELD